MAVEEDIARIRAQEKTLVFTRFDEEEAFRLGTILREKAIEGGLPVVIDIRTWDRQLFYCAMPGSTDANANWVRRKVNVVRTFAKSTYLMALEHDADDGLFSPRHGLDPADYVMAGGSFPIRLATAGVIGAVTVSGLPQRADHALVVDALCACLGHDGAALALPADGR